jgi:alpha-mannosidase
MYVHLRRNLNPILIHAFSGMVYDDAEKLYAEVRKDGECLLEEAFDALFESSHPLSNTNPEKSSYTTKDIVAFNTTPFSRRDVVKIPLHGTASQLRSKVVQTSTDGNIGYALMDNSHGGSISLPSGFYADCMPTLGIFIHLFNFYFLILNVI